MKRDKLFSKQSICHTFYDVTFSLACNDSLLVTENCFYVVIRVRKSISHQKSYYRPDALECTIIKVTDEKKCTKKYTILCFTKANYQFLVCALKRIWYVFSAPDKKNFFSLCSFHYLSTTKLTSAYINVSNAK